MRFEPASVRGHDPFHDGQAEPGTVVAGMVSAAVASRQRAKAIW
jgi:hypothetical protein